MKRKRPVRSWSLQAVCWKVASVIPSHSADPSLASEFQADATLGVRQIAQIKDTIDSLFTHETHTFPPNEVPSLRLPKIRKDEGVEIIPISLGCLGACTFCQTRLARGKLWSYPIDEIVERVHAVWVCERTSL